MRGADRGASSLSCDGDTGETARGEESRADAFTRGHRPSVVRFGAVGSVPNRSNERESRCVPLPRVASGRLGLALVGCDPNQPFRSWVLHAVALRANGSKRLHVTLGRRGGGRSIATGDESNLRESLSRVNGHY